MGGNFGPAAVAVDAGVGAHGAKDRVAGEFHVVNCFDEGVETGVQIFAPLEEKAGGAGVPIEGAIVGEIVVLSELPRGAPMKESSMASRSGWWQMMHLRLCRSRAAFISSCFRRLIARDAFLVKALLSLRAILRVVFLLAVFLLALGVVVI